MNVAAGPKLAAAVTNAGTMLVSVRLTLYVTHLQVVSVSLEAYTPARGCCKE